MQNINIYSNMKNINEYLKSFEIAELVSSHCEFFDYC